MSFKDVIKKSVLEGFVANDLGTINILIYLCIAALIGLYIFVVYRYTTKNQFYSSSFNKSLAILPVITASILLAMSSNIVISLGMVGALSIVRFRNAVKDAMDLVFLFWAISVGIIVGAGIFELAVLASMVVSVYVLALDYFPTLKAPCLLVVSATKELEEEKLVQTIHNFTKNVTVKSRNINMNGKEYIFEVQIKEANNMLNDISGLKGVISVNMLNHSGEMRV